MAILRRVGIEPAAIGLAEIEESPGLAVEGLAQEPERTSEAALQACRRQFATMEHVDDDGPRHIIGTVAVLVVRLGPSGELPDAEVIAHGVQVQPADGVQR